MLAAIVPWGALAISLVGLLSGSLGIIRPAGVTDERAREIAREVSTAQLATSQELRDVRAELQRASDRNAELARLTAQLQVQATSQSEQTRRLQEVLDRLQTLLSQQVQRRGP